MDAQHIVNQLREIGPLVFAALSAALLSLIWEWNHNAKREEACRDCPECKQRRIRLAHERRVKWAKQNGRCPHEGAYLKSGKCPLCGTEWW